MDEKLEAFLAGKSGQGVEAAQPAVVVEPVVVEPSVETAAPEPEPAAAPEPAASVAAPTPEDDDDDDAAPMPSGGTIPVHVLQAERNKRRDYKATVIRQEEQIKAAEERFKLLQAQLDELKKAPAAPPAPAAAASPPAPVPAAEAPAAAPDPMPHPAEDPDGFVAWQGRQFARMQEQQNLATFNARLDLTERALRKQEGNEAVDKAVAAFKAMVAEEEKTFGVRQSPLAKSLTMQGDPYEWMYNVVKKAEADREIGGDLAGFKAKTEAEIRERLEAELRAKIEAEMAEKAAAAAAAAPPPIQIAAVPQRAAPNVVLPKSLANAPSAAPRSAPAWSGPPPLADIVGRR